MIRYSGSARRPFSAAALASAAASAQAQNGQRVVAVTGIAVQRSLMPGNKGAALVGGGILTTVLFPALAQRFLAQASPGQGAAVT